MAQKDVVVRRQNNKDHVINLGDEMGYKPFSINELIYDPYHGAGMQNLIERQMMQEKELHLARSRGASPDINDRQDVPGDIVDNAFAGLQESLGLQQPSQ